MSRYQPAILGGLVIGVLSSLPIISAGNLCCCLWVVSGGVLATYFRQQALAGPLEAGDAALTGLLAGVIGAVLTAITSLAFHAVSGPMMQDQVRRILDQNQQMAPDVRNMVLRLLTGQNIALLMLAFVLPVYAVFSMLGSLLGLAIFKKKAPPAAPPGGGTIA